MAFQHRVINESGTLATGVPQARGILAAKVDSGEDCSLVYDGRHKFQAGGAIAAHDILTVASGGFIVAATSGQQGIGMNEYSAVTSGSYGDGVFNFMNRTLVTSEG
jgi:hypothetical protein